MRAVVISDVHLHNWQPFSRIDPDSGLNTRLLDGFDVLNQVFHYCEENHIKTIFNCGDLLHKGATISADVLELLIGWLIKLQTKGIQFVSIVGQHDFLTRDGSYNLPKGCSGLMTVLNKPGEYIDFGEFRFIGCSYRYGLNLQQEALKKSQSVVDPQRENILLGHFLLKEILEQNAAPFDNSDCVGVGDLPKVDIVLLGDYHAFCQLKGKDIISVGGLQQHSFGDSNRPQGGFLDYDFKKGNFKRIEVDAPLFIESDESFSVDMFSVRNFYKIKYQDEKKQDQIRAALTDEWSVIFEPIIEEAEKANEEAPRADIHLDMGPEQAVREYCKHLEVPLEYVEKGLSFLR